MEAAPAAHRPGRGGPQPAAAGTLTVLGCDGSYPGPGGAASGYLVARDGTTLWLDAGPGTFARLQQVADPARVDALVLTHEHPDHTSDLESFAVWLRHSGATRPVPVYAPPGPRRRSYFGGDALLDWHEVAGGDRASVGALRLAFATTDHGPPTVAVRLEAGGGTGPPAALAYSADTGAGWSVEELGEGIGTFLCEATYTRRDEGRFHHLSGRQAGAMAAAAGVGRLVVTHRWPSVAAEALAGEAGAAFGRPVVQAAPGLAVEW
ncbi:MAG: MBL fold metallo-hydrolase [Acidimicrobiales bacterium]